VLHGFNGLRQILHEWVVRPGARKIVGTLIWSACIGLIGIGSYAILNFRRDEDYLRRFREANPEVAAAAEAGLARAPAPPPPAVATNR
jgi:hypothetical protein